MECNDAISSSSSNICYFNQPINQIPGFSENKAQILSHGPDGGLVWHTVKCVNLAKVECSENDKMHIKNMKIAVIADMGSDTSECDDNLDFQSFSFVTCLKIDEDTRELVIETSSAEMMVRGRDIAGSICQPIPLTDCDVPSG